MERPSAYGMNVVSVPPSTPQVLVFPWDNKLKRFNTFSYNPQLTEGRANAQEIEAFLAEIQVPADEFVKQYSHLWAPPCWRVIPYLICFLSPFGFILLFYTIKQVFNSVEKMDQVKQRARIIIKEKERHFLQKDLKWVIPNYFPRWIELWTILNTNTNNHMGQNSVHPEQGELNQNMYRLLDEKENFEEE